MEHNHITVKCIEIKQPIGTIYIATIDWNQVCNIARSDIRRIEREEGSKVESYLGIQRRLSNRRVKEIARYVQNIDATFPTSIILHISSYGILNPGTNEEREVQNISFDPDKSEMKIRDARDVAHILDGQHRIEGLRKGLGETGKFNTQFQLTVSIFVDLDMDNQSMVFATVNKAQTKVNKSLVYDLFSYAKSRSPQRTAHLIVRLLDGEENSPFYGRIKLLGFANDPDRETITQSTLAESIIKYISKDPMSDRDNLKRNKSLKRAMGKEIEVLIFRNLFIDEKDEVIAKNIWNLFLAVKKRWPNSWGSTILSKSTGVVAFMRFLRPAYLNLCLEIGDIVSESQYFDLLAAVKIDESDFTKENYLPGATGQSKLYKELLDQTGLD